MIILNIVGSRIYKDRFEKLVAMKSTKLGICRYFNVSEKNLDKWCRKNYGKTYATLTKPKIGRPRIEIDRQQFESLCGLHCTTDEICAFFNTTYKAVDRWCKRTYVDEIDNPCFATVRKQKEKNGNLSLRRSQWALAKTNVAMAIFLGKQWLNQSDNPYEKEEKQEKVIIVDDIDAIKDVEK